MKEAISAMKRRSYPTILSYAALCCMLLFTLGFIAGCKGGNGVSDSPAPMTATVGGTSVTTVGSAPLATDVTAMEVKQQMTGSKRTAIIDVRSLQEYRYSHISGSANIPSQAIKTLRNRLPKEKSIPIIIYARGDNNSSLATAYNGIVSLGYTNVKMLRGGIIEWQDKHYPVKNGLLP
jgi:rhodanese-related sulfurtransferase